MEQLPQRVVFYDGVCHLCHWWVRRLVAADTKRQILFAPLQGETAALARQRYPEFPEEIDTAVYVIDRKLHMRSRAFFHIAKTLGGRWRALSWLRIFPAFLTDLVYRLVAWSRYKVFGKYDACVIPSVEQREALLP